MTALIKANSANAVVRFTAVAPAHAAQDPRIEALECEVGQLRTAAAEQRIRTEQAVKAARAEGEASGRAAAQIAAESQILAVTTGVDAALAAWRLKLGQLDCLAVQLTHTALRKMFGAAEEQGKHVQALLAHQVQRLGREAICTVRVSPLDFAEPKALAGLTAIVGSGSAPIVADADLASGECRIDLALGHIDIGPTAQWSELAALLEKMTAGEQPE